MKPIWGIIINCFLSAIAVVVTLYTKGLVTAAILGVLFAIARTFAKAEEK